MIQLVHLDMRTQYNSVNNFSYNNGRSGWFEITLPIEVTSTPIASGYVNLWTPTGFTWEDITSLSVKNGIDFLYNDNHGGCIGNPCVTADGTKLSASTNQIGISSTHDAYYAYGPRVFVNSTYSYTKWKIANGMNEILYISASLLCNS